MNKRVFVTIFLLFVTSVVFNYMSIYAQEMVRQLVITKVCFDPKDQEVWIEIYNPEDTTMCLNSLGMSSITSLNILPSEIRKKGGLELKAGEQIILCSNIETFKKKYGDKINVIELQLIDGMLKGGFIAINDMSGIETSKNIIRFGQTKKSMAVNLIVEDDQVLDITKDQIIYVREIGLNGRLSNWIKKDTTQSW